MNISRDVIEDLMPAYLSGDASADTKILVQEFMREDAQFAQEVARMQQGFAFATTARSRDLRPSANLEAAALMRTKAMMRRHSWMLAFSLVLTLLPFSFILSSNGQLDWIMVRNAPDKALTSWAIAIGFWIAYWLTRRKLRGAGL